MIKGNSAVLRKVEEHYSGVINVFRSRSGKIIVCASLDRVEQDRILDSYPGAVIRKRSAQIKIPVDLGTVGDFQIIAPDDARPECFALDLSEMFNRQVVSDKKVSLHVCYK